MIDGKCIGAETPVSPTSSTTTSSSGNHSPTKVPPSSSSSSSSSSTSGEVQPSITLDVNETYTAGATDENGGNSENNSNSKNKSKQAGLIAGVVVAVVAVIAAIVVVVILLIRRRNNNPVAIRTDDVSGEMAQESNNDSFRGNSNNDFNSTDNPIFAANTSENQVIEDPFINDFEEGRM